MELVRVTPRDPDSPPFCGELLQVSNGGMPEQGFYFAFYVRHRDGEENPYPPETWQPLYMSEITSIVVVERR